MHFRRMSHILDFLGLLLTDLRHCRASHYFRLGSQILDFLIGFRAFVHFGTCEWLRRKLSNFRILIWFCDILNSHNATPARPLRKPKKPT